MAEDDARRLSRLSMDAGRAEERLVETQRKIEVAAKELESLTTSLHKRKEQLRRDIESLEQERTCAAKSAEAAVEHLGVLEAERRQARELVLRASALQREVAGLEAAHDRLATEVLEKRAQIEATLQRQEEADRLLDVLTSQQGDLDKAIKERRAEQTAIEQQCLKARQQMDADWLALQTAQATHKGAMDRLTAREEKARVNEAKLRIWEGALEERERAAAVLEEESKAKVAGISQREAEVANAAAGLAKDRLDFQTRVEPRLEELKRLAQELDAQEEALRIDRLKIDAEQQELRVERSKLLMERQRLSKAQQQLQIEQDAVRAVVKKFGLADVLGNALKAG